VTTSGEKGEPIDGKFISIKANKYLKFGSEVNDLKIYDVRGREIINIKNDDGTGVIWYGTEDNSKNEDLIESGAYIYRIELDDGSVKYGTVVIVK